jgi:hypothetical protein
MHLAAVFFSMRLTTARILVLCPLLFLRICHLACRTWGKPETHPLARFPRKQPGRGQRRVIRTPDRVPGVVYASRQNPRPAGAAARDGVIPTRSDSSPALARVGYRASLSRDGTASPLAAPGSATTPVGLDSGQIQPLPPRPGPARPGWTAYSQKRELRRRLALKLTPRAARRSVHKRARSTGRLHRVHPVRLFHTQTVQDRSQIFRHCPTLVTPQFPTGPIQRHEVPGSKMFAVIS